MSLLSLPPFAALSPARQRALYSDFAPQRTTNPPGFKANVAWWSSLLLLAAERGINLGPADDEVDGTTLAGADEVQVGKGSGLVLDVGDDLVERLRAPGGGRPLALGTVIEEMIASSTLVPTASLVRASSASSTAASAGGSTSSLPIRVASTLLVTPLMWSFRQLGLGGGGGPSATGEASDRALAKVRGSYVFKPVLERLASQTLGRARSLPHSLLSETLFTPSSFRQELCPSSTALESALLLAELERRGLAVVSPDGEVVKLTLDGTGGKRGSASVGEVERGVLEMRCTIATLERQVADLELRIGERSEQAKGALAKGLKGQALSLLRSRKDLEAVLDKRVGSLGTLRGVLLKIDSSAGDVAVLKAYETSTSTLRALLALPELQLSRVEGTMDGLADALADQAEIEQAVRIGGEVASGAADERELEEELAKMAREEQEVGERETDARVLEARAKERERAAKDKAVADEERRMGDADQQPAAAAVNEQHAKEQRTAVPV